MANEKGAMIFLGAMILIVPAMTKVIQAFGSGERTIIGDHDILPNSETDYGPSSFFWFARPFNDDEIVAENNYDDDNSDVNDDAKSSTYSYVAVGAGWGR